LSGDVKKTALIFPGQGSQYVGMAKDLFEEFSSVREMFGLASDILKADLADVCFNGPEEKLKQTAFTQPAVFVHSCALDMILRENYIVASAAAGHSLGEFTALVSAGALSFDSAIRTIARRCAAMQEDCEKSPGTMAAIMGLPYESVERILRDVIGVIASANYNAPDQVVISGDRNAVEAACAKLKEAGAKRAIILQVAGAYHSPLMSHSAEVMMDYIAGMSFGEFSFPVYSNVGAEPVTDGAVFKELLARQIISPVLWYPILLNMQWDGVRRFVEVGPGKVLQGLVRRSLDDPEMEFDGIDTLDDLDNFINQYARVSHE
jgi:[acyl-carrier-protein] S-malonyltransferase